MRTRAAILTVDLGNSGGSAALFGAHPRGDADPLRCGSWSADDDELSALLAAIDRALAGAGRGSEPDAILAAVSAVGSHAREVAVVERLRSSGFPVEVRPEPGLDLRIEHPETCGSDRKYAARGAVERALAGDAARTLAAEGADLEALDGRGLLVVDAGTALTVDAVLPPRRDGGRAAFLGGAIALGPGSLATALAGAGARLPRVELAPDAEALGRSTDAALRSGVVFGFRGAVRELCREVARAAHGSEDRVTAFLAGGARAFARAAVEDVFPGRVVEDPQLVHRGLAAAAAEARP
ncbi:MAG: type III pantothenate kinase [Planctomycetota bacterium]